MTQTLMSKFQKHRFLFEELVKRDFKKKYKRTVLGMFWSILSPLLQLLVMSVVFVKFFGRSTPHYTIYLFAGNLTYSFFKESTTGGMNSLMMNANIITKINVPKYLFLLSKNVSSLINFGLTLIIFFLFVAIDGIPFTPKFFMLLFPILCLIVFNIGVGFILSAMFVIFKDIQYLYDIFTLLLLFYVNPMFTYISYIRSIVLHNTIPPLWHHGLCLLYALLAISIGALIYKRNNYKFLYYM